MIREAMKSAGKIALGCLVLRGRERQLALEVRDKGLIAYTLRAHDEVRSAGPYRDLAWEDFEQVVDFVSTGGYALKTYDRFRRIVRGEDGRWRARTAFRRA